MDQVRSDEGSETTARPASLFIRYRDGLILALWAVTALRRGEFTDLRIRPHLLILGDRARIEILASQRKRTSIGLSIPVPERLVPYLQHYLAWRARLPEAPHHDALWVDALGRPLGYQGVARALGLRTKEALGTYVPLHALRYGAATWIAMNHPTHVETAMAVLGHARLATTSDFYIMGQCITAQRKVIANLRALRPDPSKSADPK